MRSLSWVILLSFALLASGCGNDSSSSSSDASVSDPDSGGDGGAGDDAETTDGGVDPDSGADGQVITEPPALPTYSGGTCPVLTGGPDVDNSVVNNFNTSGENRSFRFIVPENYDGSTPWPLVFGWHVMWSNSGQFATDADIVTASSQMQMLFVLFDSVFGGPIFNWPFHQTETAPEELVFFDDVLACVAEQYNVDLYQIHGVGGSAGALWLTQISSTERVNHLATVVTISGGLGETDVEPLDGLHMEFTPQANKFPAMLVVGHDDVFILNFTEATARYRDALLADGHFVIHCIHPDDGHVIPNFVPPQGMTKFWAAWRFMLDHPWGTSPSPYTTLPVGFPDFCVIAE